jgi:hypothetical protein
VADTPWLKFYPQDWMGEPRLRACSLAARGLWMEMIALAHQATPYGHVLINGNAPDIATLARMVGATESECEALMAELDRNGVFSRTRKGIVYSRRMIKDAKRTAHARNIGKQGGNPKLLKTRRNTAQDNHPVMVPDKTQKPEARSQKEAAPDGADAREEFPAWYAGYPHKVGRAAALKAFRTARRKADLPALFDGLRRYIATKPPDRPWCNPATWLNQERWLDREAPTEARGPPRRAPGAAVLDAFDEIHRRLDDNAEPDDPLH